MAETKVKRVPKNQATLGANDIAGMVVNTRAGANKTLIVGGQLKTPSSATQVVATDFSAGKSVTPGTSLALYNNSGTVAWATMNQVALGALIAPSSGTTGIPLAPNAWTYLNMGDNDTFQTSAATVLAYIIQDDTTFQYKPSDQQF
jgi:hypothetical protein